MAMFGRLLQQQHSHYSCYHHLVRRLSYVYARHVTRTPQHGAAAAATAARCRAPPHVAATATAALRWASALTAASSDSSSSGRRAKERRERQWRTASHNATRFQQLLKTAGLVSHDGRGFHTTTCAAEPPPGGKGSKAAGAGLPKRPMAGSKSGTETTEELPEETTSTVKMAFAGNLLITLAKFAMWSRTGSSAMFAEALHTAVDCGNQAFLLLGLRQSSLKRDTVFQYGYGRAAFFWALISALGMFWMGACVSVIHGVEQLWHPAEQMTVTWEVWGVLGLSFAIDGVVFTKAFKELAARAKEEKTPMLRHLITMKDPFLLAVLLEDFAACAGVMIAVGGLGLTAVTGNVIYDSLASIAIGTMLGVVAVVLVRKNQRFLIGHAVESEIVNGIQEIILSRPAVESVYEVQSQWLGPTTFTYKAEVDFDGSNLAARLHAGYEREFVTSHNLKQDLPVLLACYAEDVTRLVEREVKVLEALIRQKYPQAAYIEIEPDSHYSFKRKLDDMGDRALRRYEGRIMAKQLTDIQQRQGASLAAAGFTSRREQRRNASSSDPSLQDLGLVRRGGPEALVQVASTLNQLRRQLLWQATVGAVRHKAKELDRESKKGMLGHRLGGIGDDSSPRILPRGWEDSPDGDRLDPAALAKRKLLMLHGDVYNRAGVEHWDDEYSIDSGAGASENLDGVHDVAEVAPEPTTERSPVPHWTDLLPNEDKGGDKDDGDRSK